MTLRALIFDVDGTLANTERDGHRPAFNAAFSQAGLAWHWDEAFYGTLLAVTGGKERILHLGRDQRAGKTAALQFVLAGVDRGRNVKREDERQPATGRAGRCRHGGREDRARPYQCPVLPMLAQGSSGAFAAPFCKSSTEMLSGERTKAMCPSRGGRLIVTPLA